MHIQRVLLAAACVALAGAVALPWITESATNPDVPFWGYDLSVVKTMGGLALCCLALTATGQRAEPLKMFSALLLGLYGLYSLGAGLWFYYYCSYPLNNSLDERMKAELLWPGYGAYVAIVAGLGVVGLLLMSLFLFRQSKTPSASPKTEAAV
ncbi:hypothetical protein [Lignipirellula cremea]|uniref:hypothetical protein n=1 Tax=Lignipirellula cremea TaxID=2528010 RepID=UPI0011A7ABD2|nr:hypothetical protein [Lignipirellula cremea]